MKERLASFIVSEILRDRSRELSFDEPLLTSGLIDSFSLLDLALYVEGAFGVRIEDFELRPEVFNNVNELADLIAGRQGQGVR